MSQSVHRVITLLALGACFLAGAVTGFGVALAGDEAQLKAAEHWAYVKPQRPDLPAVNEPSWGRNPIDRFILARLEHEELQPSPEADRAKLLRRVYLDLIGLPPSVAEVDAFLNDPRPDAYERVVDRLLASPHYGEHWARQWLDLARYADSNGFQADQYREVWPYRDWVINALNADMPFERFTIEQLAGDLLPDSTPAQQIATGFHRLTTCNVEAGVDPEENRVNQIIDRVNTTGTVWLGTTIQCAQCHDHKYDPFNQADYYRLFAYFNNTPLEVKLASGVTFDFYGPKMNVPLPPDKAAQRRELQQQRKTLQDRLDGLIAETAARQSEWEQRVTGDPEAIKKLPKDIRTILNAPPDKRSKKQTRKLADSYLGLNPDIKATRADLDVLKQELENLAPPTTLVMTELDKPRQTHVFTRGNFLTPAGAVEPGTPAALPDPSSDSPSNRLGLAKWLVDRDNPLTARVTVNRWWAQYFGRGIVATLEDFGTQGEPPTHPKLLDWLAVEFMTPASSPPSQQGKPEGWSMKHIHRLIVTSATYRQSSRVTPELLKRDPYNTLYARGPRFRLSAEAIRDNALMISGLLSEKMGGAPVYPPQPPGIWRHVGRNAPKYETDTGPDRFRRGVYTFWRRSAPYPSFVNFDAPDRTSCTVNRPRTNTPLQALTLLNDEAYVEMAQAFAHRILTETAGKDLRDQVVYAFRCCAARHPTSEEADHLMQVYQREFDRFKKDPQSAQELVGTSRWSKDVDSKKLAAWFYVTNILLNLDETISKG